jgi:transposase
MIDMFDDVLVPMPEAKVLFRSHPNGTTYVYYTVAAFRNKAGKPTSKVKAIGKQDQATGKLVPNLNYYVIFKKEDEIPEIKAKVRTTSKPIESTEIIGLSNKIDGKSTSMSNIPSGIKSIGTCKVFFEIAERIQLIETLKKCFHTKWDRILLASFYMLSEGNVMSYIGEWSDDNKIEFTHKINDVDSSRLFESITYEERQIFFTEWLKCLTDSEHFVFDSTSFSSWSNSIELVEWGYNRDGDNLPQVNFGMFYGMTSGLPVYYHLYNGSVPDKACIKFMMANAIDIGINKVCFVIDGCLITEENVNVMFESDYAFITTLSLSRTDAPILIDQVKNNIAVIENWVPEYKMFAVKQAITLYGYKLYAHIYYNPDKQARDLNEITSKIEKLDKELDKLNNTRYVTKRFTDYFDVDMQSKNSLDFKLDTNKVNLKISRAGFFILLSSDDRFNSAEVLEIYRKKDGIEKNFYQIKNDIDFKRLKTHNVDTTHGKIFTGFIALILRSYLNKTIRNHKELRKLTFEKILIELRKIRTVNMSNQTEIPMTLTKTQKNILEWLGVRI